MISYSVAVRISHSLNASNTRVSRDQQSFSFGGGFIWAAAAFPAPQKRLIDSHCILFPLPLSPPSPPPLPKGLSEGREGEGEGGLSPSLTPFPVRTSAKEAEEGTERGGWLPSPPPLPSRVSRHPIIGLLLPTAEREGIGHSPPSYFPARFSLLSPSSPSFPLPNARSHVFDCAQQFFELKVILAESMLFSCCRKPQPSPTRQSARPASTEAVSFRSRDIDCFRYAINHRRQGSYRNRLQSIREKSSIDSFRPSLSLTQVTKPCDEIAYVIYNTLCALKLSQ